MTTNDLVYKISERAKALVNQPIDELRLHLGTANFKTPAIAEHRYSNRGELVEMILCDEFLEEFPRDTEREEQ